MHSCYNYLLEHVENCNLYRQNNIQIKPSIEVNTWIYRPINIYRPRKKSEVDIYF